MKLLRWARQRSLSASGVGRIPAEAMNLYGRPAKDAAPKSIVASDSYSCFWHVDSLSCASEYCGLQTCFGATVATTVNIIQRRF